MAHGSERAQHAAGDRDVVVGATGQNGGLAGSDQRWGSENGRIDEGAARRLYVPRQLPEEVRPGGAHLDKTRALARCEGAVRPEVCGEHGLRTGQATDDKVGIPCGDCRRINDSAEAECIGSRPRSIPQHDLKPGGRQSGRDCGTHLAGAENGDPARNRAVCGRNFRIHRANSFGIASGAGPPTATSACKINSIWAMSSGACTASSLLEAGRFAHGPILKASGDPSEPGPG